MLVDLYLFLPSLCGFECIKHCIWFINPLPCPLSTSFSTEEVLPSNFFFLSLSLFFSFCHPLLPLSLFFFCSLSFSQIYPSPSLYLSFSFSAFPLFQFLMTAAIYPSLLLSLNFIFFSRKKILIDLVLRRHNTLTRAFNKKNCHPSIMLPKSIVTLQVLCYVHFVLSDEY